MTLSTFKKVALAAALVSAFGSVSAAIGPTVATRDFGVLNGTKTFSNISITGPFEHQFSFTIDSLPGVLGGVVGLDILGDLATQYRFGTGSTPTWGGWSSTAPVPSDAETGVFSFSKTLNGLTPGETYWFGVTGSATQAAYSVTLAPVPEPETYALLLSGLALMGAVARRRKANAAKAGA